MSERDGSLKSEVQSPKSEEEINPEIEHPTSENKYTANC